MSKAAWLGLVIKTLQDTGFSKKRINEIIKKIEKLLTTKNEFDFEKIYQKIKKKESEEKNAN